MPLITLKVPATTANLGSGFDTLGMALSLYNIFTVKELLPAGEYTCEISGEGVDELKDARKNMIVTSYLKACEEWGIEPSGFAFECCNAVPLNRGLGSSSTAVVAGVMIADFLGGAKHEEGELLRVMTKEVMPTKRMAATTKAVCQGDKVRLLNREKATMMTKG